MAAWCEGRWGRRRRARVEECLSITAEGAYDALLRDARWTVYPGAQGTVVWTVDGLARQVAWQVRANRIWRRGRVLLTCAACGRRATRIYLPTADAPAPACRSCWGLSYESRQLNYRNGGLLKKFGLTSRAFAQRQTWLNRRRARAAARARWAVRRTLGTLLVTGA
jgi:hypothetical protein